MNSQINLGTYPISKMKAQTDLATSQHREFHAFHLLLTDHDPSPIYPSDCQWLFETGNLKSLLTNLNQTSPFPRHLLIWDYLQNQACWIGFFSSRR
jgi:hypothetical protein